MRQLYPLEQIIRDLEKLLVESPQIPEDQKFLRSEIIPKLSEIHFSLQSKVNEKKENQEKENEKKATEVRNSLLKRFFNKFEANPLGSKIPILIVIAYECLRTLTYFFPINEVGAVSMEKVYDNDMFLCVDGYKLNLVQDIYAFTLNRKQDFVYFDKNNEEFRALINPFTRQPLHALDINTIVQDGIEKQLFGPAELAFHKSKYFFSIKVLHRLVPEELKSNQSPDNNMRELDAHRLEQQLRAVIRTLQNSAAPTAPTQHFSKRLYCCYFMLCGYLSYLSADYVYAYTQDYVEQTRSFEIVAPNYRMCSRSPQSISIPLRNTFLITLVSNLFTFISIPLFPQEFFKSLARKLIPINLGSLSPLIAKLFFTFSVSLLSSVFLGREMSNFSEFTVVWPEISKLRLPSFMCCIASNFLFEALCSGATFAKPSINRALAGASALIPQRYHFWDRQAENAEPEGQVPAVS